MTEPSVVPHVTGFSGGTSPPPTPQQQSFVRPQESSTPSSVHQQIETSCLENSAGRYFDNIEKSRY